jgi:hypothetical protein
MFFLIFSTNLSEIFYTLRTQRDTIIHVSRSSCKVGIILVIFQRNLNFMDIFSKNRRVSNFIKILPVGAELFHTDRYGEAYSRVSQFFEVPKTLKIC